MQTDAPRTTTTDIDPADYMKPAAEASQPDDASTPTGETQDVNPVKVQKSGTRVTVSVKINVVREADRQEIRRFNRTHGTPS